MSKKNPSGQLLGGGVVAMFGINAVMGMTVYAIQKVLATLPEDLKFWLFWLGTIVASLAISYAALRIMWHKKVHWAYVGSVAAVGIMVIVLASPLLPAFFPINPTQLAMSGQLQAGGSDNPFPTIAVGMGFISLLVMLCILFWRTK